MECPYIDRSIEGNAALLPRDYPLPHGGAYRYWQSIDPYNNSSNLCQYCQRVGRVKDVFRCLNEDEWRACPYCADGLSKDE